MTTKATPIILEEPPPPCGSGPRKGGGKVALWLKELSESHPGQWAKFPAPFSYKSAGSLFRHSARVAGLLVQVQQRRIDEKVWVYARAWPKEES